MLKKYLCVRQMYCMYHAYDAVFMTDGSGEYISNDDDK